MRPPIPYFGAKTTLAPQIVKLIRPHEHYVEPYAGSLAVLLAKPPSAQETANDLDRRIVNFWRVLRDRPGDLERMAALTPHSRAEYCEARAVASDEGLEAAWATWVKLTQAVGAAPGRDTAGWRTFITPCGTSIAADYLPRFLGRMAPAAARLSRVSLECRPAFDVIDRYGRSEGTALYVDPPYWPGTVTRNAGYRHEHSESEHLELLELLKRCQADVILSGYASEAYDSTLAGWSRIEIRATAGNAVLHGHETGRTEVLWLNYEPDRHVQDHLAFDLGAAA